MKKQYVPIRYLPSSLSKKDKKKQINMLIKSKKLYKQHKYYNRNKLQSYKNKPSKHIVKARKLYKLETIYPNAKLSRATGCSINSLQQIVKKVLFCPFYIFSSLFFLRNMLHHCTF